MLFAHLWLKLGQAHNTGPARQTILGHRAAGHRRLSWPSTVRGGLAGHEDGGQEPDLAFRRLWRLERLPPTPTAARQETAEAGDPLFLPV